MPDPSNNLHLSPGQPYREGDSTVPRSRRRSKDDFTPPDPNRREGASAPWVAPTMVALLLLGLAWIVIFYVAGEYIPVIGDLGGWNLVIGMGLITAGFVVATQWR